MDFAEPNIAQALLTQAERHPRATALTYVSVGKGSAPFITAEWDFQTLAAAAQHAAHGLTKVGLGYGQRVALMVPPSLEFYALSFGLMLAGAVPVLIDPGMGLKAIKKCLARANPHGFIGSGKAHAARKLLGWQRGHDLVKIYVGNGIVPRRLRYADIIAAGAGSTMPLATVKAEDQAAILFTSGSTGTPKGAVYCHSTFGAQVQALQDLFGLGPGDTDCATFPLFGLFGPALGMRVVIPPMDFTRPGNVDPQVLARVLNECQCSTMFGSPALLKRLIQGLKPDSLALPFLKCVISAGAPVSAHVLKDFSRLVRPGVPIYTPYGATEALPVAVITSQEILAGPQDLATKGRGICVGRAAPRTAIRIMKILDAPVASWTPELLAEPGEVGEIVVSGPQVTQAYFAQEDADRLSKVADPASGQIWHRMGDLGYFDSTERLWFAGRKSQRVCAASNETFFTIPVEGVYLNHPAVARAALVGIRVRAPVPSKGFGAFWRRDYLVPAVVIEPHAWPRRRERSKLRRELRAVSETAEVILFHRRFPVDRRHNAKIFREKLAQWAAWRWEVLYYAYFSHRRRWISRQGHHQASHQAR